MGSQTIKGGSARMNKKIRNLIAVAMVSTMSVSTLVMGNTIPYMLQNDDQVMVPVRKAAEVLGFAVNWDGMKQQITLENGKTKLTFKPGEDAYQKSTGRLSGECIMMYVPKALGEAAVIKEGTTYVPVEVFDYALDDTGVLVVKEDQVVTKEKLKISYYKELPLLLGDKMYSISMNLPDYIGPYVTLKTEKVGTGEATYPIVSLQFENEDGIANIGIFSIFTHEQYEAVKGEGGPIPTEVLVTKAYVVGFTGLQDMPFELDTKAAELVGAYHEGVGEILKTVTLAAY